MKPIRKSYQYVIAILAGALAVLAFAPINQFYCAIVSTLIFYQLLVMAKDSKSGFKLGFLYGFGFFGAGVSWVYVSIHVYGFTPAWLAALLTTLFVSVLALFPACQGWFLKRFFSLTHKLVLLIVYPVSFALIEWIRSWLFTGFPWLLLGYSQVHSPLKGYIPILGAYGVTFLIVATGSMFYYLYTVRNHWPKAIAAICTIIGIWLGGFGLAQIHWTHKIRQPVSVAMVQGNISQSIKWDPQSFANTLKIYYDATKAHWHSNIIIWPEAAVPIPKRYAQPFLDKLSDAAKARNVSVFLGIPVGVPDTFSYYNALIALGQGQGHYYKRHLVPFGEYVPFAGLLRGLMGFLSLPMSNMISGPVDQPDLKAGAITLAPFICYEIAYASALRHQAPKSDVLVTVSDDAWFGDSLAPAQHLEIGQFRAIQSGRDLLFAGNDGITALVNAKGEIYKGIPQFEEGVLTGFFQPRTGMTPWLYYGNAPIIVILWLLFGILFYRERRAQ